MYRDTANAYATNTTPHHTTQHDTTQHSCAEAGGHHYPAGGRDGWVGASWTSDDLGVSDEALDVDGLTSAFGFADNARRVVVVHDSAGERAACGVLRPFVADEDFA